MKKKGLVILSTSAPYSTPFLHDRLRQIEELASIYPELIIFHYIDGIHQLNSEQDPKVFPNIAEIHKRLNESRTNVRYFACSRCTGARGYIDPNGSDPTSDVFNSYKLLPFVKIVSLKKLAEYLNKGYDLIQI